MLNTQSPIPLYRQLADLLTAKIREGEYAAGSRIPSENQLAATFSIGRPTARHAIDLLVRKGLLDRRRGAGTFVCEAQQEVDLFSLDGTSASFRKGGLSIETRIITPIHRLCLNDDPGNPFTGRSAFFLSRLTQVDNTPVLIENLYLDTTLFAGIEKLDLESRSLSAIAEEQFYLRPTGGKQSFDIGHPDSRCGRYLNISSQTPVLVVKRFLHFPQMANGVFCRLWCRTDQFVFTQNIGGNQYA
ncbi:MAG: GntR family transcriptional regulator [Desulfobacteraceae bacterium]|jgi:GntR family transcriptional regulator